ncbi:glycoside hydrolase family 95 protein [Salegentibacter sp. F188]|uniref:Glycoside hydrolase family 95 protein n=1 Tax=Autumnicola patrickiae TaxID=3075591 RepID=A0ABU3E160_9FLAO|nr:glycoside hydrolase family 95 protein [Salegentibacter sp. F188]MDT0689706.1 glycoside hydrolase family 95 protein [Salegentibacter sp. F188]
MKNSIKLLLVLAFLISSENYAQQEAGNKNILWYTTPAENWDHALPVGNGRMGAMVFGDPESERIQLNEDSLWPGGPDWGNSKGTPEDLAEIRKLVEAGQFHLADSLIVERFSYKGVARSHQTMGDLFIEYQHENIKDYKRSLDLENAVASTTYTADGYSVTQDVFSSAEDDVLIVKIKTENPDGIAFKLTMSRPEDNGHQTVEVTSPQDNMLNMRGMVTQYAGARDSEPVEIDYGVKFEAILKAEIEKGTVEAKNNTLQFKNVKEAVLYIVASTSFYHEDFAANNQKTLEKLQNKNYKELLERHIADYQQFYNRTSLNLGDDHLDSLTTTTRLERVKEGQQDLGLVEKLFQYGRYLLISSSRPGTNPANLQGLWNEHIQAPWNADYHLNINLQMNYWPAGPANLIELQEPLFDLTDRLIERGKILAREQYGMSGTVAHQTTDLWAAPWMQAETAYWGSWIHGGGWLAQHYWEHYRFTQDTTFLKERAYPALKAYAEFYSDWLTEDPRDGTLISTPETSPENRYLAPDGEPAALSRGTAMGHQIIAEVFDNTIASAEILGKSDEFTQKIKAQRAQLRTGIQIGNDGRILEWDREYEEPEKGHRHISHLYALHPGDDITVEDPELFEAARKTIEHRLEHGGAGPGWSRAWIINFYARLLDAEAAQKHINLFMQRSIYPNLLDIHPPFQIDGNFGFTAGIAEMLLQSHEGFLRILPALPVEWAKGNVSGLKARGNIEVGISWKQGLLEELSLTSETNKTIRVVYGEQETEVALVAGKSIILNKKLKIKNR